MSDDFAPLREDVHELKAAVKELTAAVQSMALGLARLETNDAHRAAALVRFEAIPSLVTGLDERLKGIEHAGAAADRWVGPMGYLRSKAFGGIVIAVLILFGAVRWSDIREDLPTWLRPDTILPSMEDALPAAAPDSLEPTGDTGEDGVASQGDTQRAR